MCFWNERENSVASKLRWSARPVKSSLIRRGETQLVYVADGIICPSGPRRLPVGWPRRACCKSTLRGRREHRWFVYTTTRRYSYTHYSAPTLRLPTLPPPPWLLLSIVAVTLDPHPRPYFRASTVSAIQRSWSRDRTKRFELLHETTATDLQHLFKYFACDDVVRNRVVFAIL